MCVVTRESLPKDSLFRIVNKNGELIYDKNQNIQGRGVYLKKDINIILKAQKNHILEKKFSTNNNDYLYQMLISELERK